MHRKAIQRRINDVGTQRWVILTSSNKEFSESSIEKTGKFEMPSQSDSGKLQLSATQAEVLRLIAHGLSNASIAKERDITLRAAEALIQRTFSALGIKGDPDVNSRLVAVKMWQQGKVFVK